VNEATIQNFWNGHPCGEHQVGGLAGAFLNDYAAFFEAYDAHRYRKEPHIRKALDRFDFRGKKVLEVGLGQGADSEQLIRRGARWSGLDLTPESVERVKMRMTLRNLPFEEIKIGSALSIPYGDKSFDIVFSHGVLHHIPDIRKAQTEIRRVLRDDGALIVMLYAKNSLNYQVSIRIVRRVGLAAIYLLRLNLGGIYERHRQNAAQIGLRRYLRMGNFIHRSTDGPDNPYSKVYDLDAIRRDFPDFALVNHFKMWLHAPPLPTARLPGGSLLGWHLWAELKPKM
jgi:SAM-dependent methyltransferase